MPGDSSLYRATLNSRGRCTGVSVPFCCLKQSGTSITDSRLNLVRKLFSKYSERSWGGGGNHTSGIASAL